MTVPSPLWFLSGLGKRQLCELNVADLRQARLLPNLCFFATKLGSFPCPEQDQLTPGTAPEPRPTSPLHHPELPPVLKEGGFCHVLFPQLGSS